MTHTVQQGEHISQITAKYNFLDYRIIWDHAGNSELKKIRKSPNVLLPGDVLFIPERSLKTADLGTAQTHVFVVRVPTLQLRIVLRDFDNQTLPGLECVLEVDGKSRNLKSNAKGLVECEVSVLARKGKLSIPDLDTELPLQIGHLDPHDSETGWKARLANLGYWVDSGSSDEERAEILNNAFQEFQCDYGLKVTGEPDAQTLAKLLAIHGC